MANDIPALINSLNGSLPENAYEISDTLGHIGEEEVLVAMLKLLSHGNDENRIIASRTLGKLKDNAAALPNLLEAITAKENVSIAGDLLVALEGFDISDRFVEIFKLYLFGSFKVSNIAKDLLDYKEFDITPRVIKKAKKHWNHYSNNIKHDDAYQLRKVEVEEMFEDMEDFTKG
ncbi:HEAT repeat domain-containing protein [Fulvivirga sp.]|uniref:HEAT repeat domain-containing protein n=1 Tax=Fulvivirga sp. TaxID=1931237 RepID=UPI0032EAFF19